MYTDCQYSIYRHNTTCQYCRCQCILTVSTLYIDITPLVSTADVSCSLTVSTTYVEITPPVSTADVNDILTVSASGVAITPPVSTAGVSYMLSVSTVGVSYTPPVSTADVSYKLPVSTAGANASPGSHGQLVPGLTFWPSARSQVVRSSTTQASLEHTTVREPGKTRRSDSGCLPGWNIRSDMIN